MRSEDETVAFNWARLVGASGPQMKITIEIEDDDVRRLLKPLLERVQSASEARNPARLLTVSEVAYRLGVSRPKVYDLISTGDIEALIVGRTRRIAAAALDEFVAKSGTRLRSHHPSPRDLALHSDGSAEAP